MTAVVCVIWVSRCMMRVSSVVLGALSAPSEVLRVVLMLVEWYVVAPSEVYVGLIVTVLGG